jgi:hypothetical protein
MRASAADAYETLLGTTRRSGGGDGCSKTKPAVCRSSIEAPLAIELDEYEQHGVPNRISEEQELRLGLRSVRLLHARGEGRVITFDLETA